MNYATKINQIKQNLINELSNKKQIETQAAMDNYPTEMNNQEDDVDAICHEIYRRSIALGMSEKKARKMYTELRKNYR